MQCNDRLRPLYDLLPAKPDLSNQPVPMTSVPTETIHGQALRDSGLQSRLSYNCSFCTVINVQGHKVRSRSVVAMTRAIRENYRRNVLHYYSSPTTTSREPMLAGGLSDARTSPER